MVSPEQSLAAELSDQIISDAAEFGEHVRHAGWRLALLVCRSVEPGLGVGGNSSVVRTSDCGKISASAFARAAGKRISADTVMRYYRAWERAAAENKVPSAEKLRPGVDPPLIWEDLPEWLRYYEPRKHDSAARLSRRAVRERIRTDPSVAEEARAVLAEIDSATPPADEPEGNEEIQARAQDLQVVDEVMRQIGAKPYPDAPPRSLTPALEDSGAEPTSSGGSRRTASIMDCLRLLDSAVGKLESLAPLDQDEQNEVRLRALHLMQLLPVEAQA